MAFGLSPQRIQEVSLDNLTPQQFLALAFETAITLNLEIRDISKIGFIANTKMSMNSFSEEIEVEINDKTAILKSGRTSSQITDRGENQDIVTDFISSFNEMKGAFSGEELKQKSLLLE
jgi:rhomboid protease GluP